ncbi:MAG: hypothetical protein LBS26_00825 [Campylobacteraceae bacterium]|jgi:hypothetical protein|nr:hypothetical protein [Campylobacteraceae bacterium]
MQHDKSCFDWFDSCVWLLRGDFGGENAFKDLSVQQLNLLHEQSTAQYKDLTSINAIELSKYNFAPLFMDTKEYDCNFLGYIGDDFWRLYIVFDEIKKVASLKYSTKRSNDDKGKLLRF